MADNQKIKQIGNFWDKIFSNPIIRIISILGVFASLYGTYKLIFKDKPNLEYRIITDVNVIEFNQDVKLDILYDSINISKNNLGLKIYEISVVNNGNETLLENFYVSQEIGFKIKNGMFVEAPKIFDESNKYIKEETSSFHFMKDSVTVLLPKIALDEGDHYSIKLLVLHDKKEIPTIEPIGKIAGTNMIKIERINSNKKQSIEINITWWLVAVMLLVASLILLMLILQIQKQMRIMVKEIDKKNQIIEGEMVKSYQTLKNYTSELQKGKSFETPENHKK